MADQDSVYNYYKNLIHLRKEKDIMVYGTYELLDPEDEALYVYTRTLGDQKLLVMCNFTKEEQEYTVPETFAGADVLISNYPQSGAAAGARKLRMRQLFWKPNKKCRGTCGRTDFCHRFPFSKYGKNR